MKRPEVTLNNYQAVYDWYQQYRQPRPITKLAYAALDLYYKPDLYFAEGARDEFDQFRSDSTSQIFVFNHLTNKHDQFVASAVAHLMIPEDVGRTRVLAKDELFRGAQGRFVNLMGAVPTFRKKDHAAKTIVGTLPESAELTQDMIDQMLTQQAQTVDHANDAMFAAVGNMVAAGNNLAVFGEGTHNKVDPTVLQKLRPGFARIALHAYNLGANVAITPIGMSFGQSLDSLDPRKAAVVIAPSIRVESTDTIETLVEDTRGLLQTAIDQANMAHTSVRQS